MKTPTPYSLLCATLLVVPFTSQAAPAAVPPLKAIAATASSETADYPAAKAIDGIVDDKSRWVSAPSLPAWLEIRLDGVHKLGGLHLVTGYKTTDAIEAFSVSFWSNNQWQEIPSVTVTKNAETRLVLAFDATVDVITDRIRINITQSPKNIARIKEVVIWPYAVGDIPPIADQSAAPALAQTSASAPAPAATAAIPLIYLNQSGFNLGKPKRFTAPTLAEGTPFVVRPAKGGPPLVNGVIKNNVGDFSQFNPASSDEYVVEAGDQVSVPFRVGPWWLERVTYQNAVNFMIDSRHYVGNVTAPCKGSYGWRDDHHFGWELHTLVPQLISNPSAYERMPRQIRYQAPADTALWGKLEPYREDVPDIVKLIHWGADVIVTQGLTQELLKSQLAYFLYAWPVLQDYLPAQNYTVVRDFAFAHWADATADHKYPYDASPEHNLLALKTKLGSTKGEYPPGFSVQPNLMMYQVALREKRPDAETYFDAAYRQTEWMIANLDWNNPQVTKGQRMSEFITLTGLAYFAAEFPSRAPSGLIDKINTWAEVITRRSDNLWDFRKLDDGERWTPMDPSSPQKWNEVGNVVGLPAAILAAQPFIKDPARRDRLTQLVWSHLDDMFGRNPTGRHFSYDAPREIEGVENGWYKFHKGGIGQLENARFVLDGSPKDYAYPYQPENGARGWTEGWVQFNTPFNLSLSYLAASDTRLTATRDADALKVRLRAPLNFDYVQVESAQVKVTSSSGDEERVTLKEESTNSDYLSGAIPLKKDKPASVGNGTLEVVGDGEAEIAYGFGYLGHTVKVKL